MYPKVRGVAQPAANSNIQYTSEEILRRSSDFDEHRDRMSNFDDILYTIFPQDLELSSVNDSSIELVITSDLYGIMALRPRQPGFRRADRGTRARPATENKNIFLRDPATSVEKRGTHPL